VGVTSHQGARESRAQGEVAQVVGCPEPVRYARCGTPKQVWSLCERCSQEATGELLEIERLTSSLERGHWKSTRQGNSLVAYSTVCPVRGGPGEKAIMTSLVVYPTFAALRSGFRQQVSLGVGLQTLQRTLHMNMTLSPVRVSPRDECSRPASVSPSPPHACPWDQGCYNAMDNTGTRRERP
jgi:hypothetical protein